MCHTQVANPTLCDKYPVGLGGWCCGCAICGAKAVPMRHRQLPGNLFGESTARMRKMVRRNEMKGNHSFKGAARKGAHQESSSDGSMILWHVAKHALVA